MSQTKYYLSAVFLGVVIFLFLQPLRKNICETDVFIPRSPKELEGDYQSTLNSKILKLQTHGKYQGEEDQGIWKIMDKPREQILILTSDYSHARKDRFQVTAYGMKNIQTLEKFVKKRYH